MKKSTIILILLVLLILWVILYKPQWVVAGKVYTKEVSLPDPNRSSYDATGKKYDYKGNVQKSYTPIKPVNSKVFVGK